MKKISITFITLCLLFILFADFLLSGQDLKEKIVVQVNSKSIKITDNLSINDIIVKQEQNINQHSQKQFIPLPIKTNSNYLVHQNRALNYNFDTGPIKLDDQVWTNSYNNVVFYRAATDGNQYLVVWYEINERGEEHIKVNFISGSGQLLNPNPIKLPTLNPGMCIDVAYGDGIYLIIWEEESAADDWFYGMRISADGNILDPSGFLITELGGKKGEFAICYGAGEFMIIYSMDDSFSDTADLFGIRVQSDGQVIDPYGFVVSQRASYQCIPAICFDGSLFLVAWSDGYLSAPYPNIYCARIASNGFVIDPDGILVCNAPKTQFPARITYYSNQFLLIWEDCRYEHNTLFGARVKSDGSVLDPNGFMISDSLSDAGWLFSRTNIGLIPYSSDALVVFDEQDDSNTFCFLKGVRIDPQGQIVTKPAACITSQKQFSTHPIIAGSGNEMNLFWIDMLQHGLFMTFGSDLKSSKFNPDFTLQDTLGINIDNMLNTSRHPAIAWDGQRYLAVWSDNRQRNGVFDSTAFDLYGRFFKSDGSYDGSAFVIEDSVGSQFNPEIIFNGNNYFVIWQGAKYYQDFWLGFTTWNIYGRRISPDGTLLDSKQILISNEFSKDFDKHEPKIAFDGNNYLVTWIDDRQGYPAIYGTRVTTEGIVLDSTNIWISFASGNTYSPSITFGREYYLVVWYDHEFNIRYRRIGTDGIPIDPVSGSFTNDNINLTPALAYQDSLYMLVWSKWIEEYQKYGLVGVTILDDMTVSEPETNLLYLTDGYVFFPDIVYGDTSYIATFQDWDGNNNIYRVGVAGISSEASPLDSNWYLISQSDNDLNPKITKGPGDTVVVAWTTHFGENQPTDEAYLRFFTLDTFKVMSNIPIADEILPTKCGLFPNYPNPFNPTTTIKFALQKESTVIIRIYNILGQELAILLNEPREPGLYKINWNASEFPSGIYYCLMSTNHFTDSMKLLLMK